MLPGFETPNWRAPLPWREMIANVPAEAAVRGVFFNNIADALLKVGHQEKSRTSFKLYPLSELMELEVRAAELLYPKQPLREGLRRLGRVVYTSLLSTTPGKVLISLAGIDFKKLLALASKAYSVSLNVGSLELRETHDRWARYVLTDVYNFAECTQVGVLEGAMEAYQIQGSVRIKPGTWSSAELLVEWTS